MDRRTFVKAGCIGSASLLMQGLDPMIRAESAPTAVPPIELRGLADYKPSPLGMPGLYFPGESSRSATRVPSSAIVFRNPS